MTEENNPSTKYNPQEVEAGRYQHWLGTRFVWNRAEIKAKPYSIAHPTPNVTGSFI